MSITETITWYSATERRPGDGRAVLLGAPDGDQHRPVVVGLWDGSSWRYGDGWPLDEAQVAYWAEMPRGPR